MLPGGDAAASCCGKGCGAWLAGCPTSCCGKGEENPQLLKHPPLPVALTQSDWHMLPGRDAAAASCCGAWLAGGLTNCCWEGEARAPLATLLQYPPPIAPIQADWHMLPGKDAAASCGGTGCEAWLVGWLTISCGKAEERPLLATLLKYPALPIAPTQVDWPKLPGKDAAPNWRGKGCGGLATLAGWLTACWLNASWLPTCWLTAGLSTW